MTSDLRKGNREVLEEFIRIYQSEQCLWRIKSKEYHDKAKRDDAYHRLQEQLKQIDPSADRDKVVKKINSLRTNLRKEKKKVQESQRSGAGAEQIYEPAMWYYHSFDFLRDQDCPRSSSSNINERDGEAAEQSVEDPDPDVGQSVEESQLDLEQSVGECQPIQPPAHGISISPEQDSIRSPTPNKQPQSRPRKRMASDKYDTVLQTIDDHFKKPKLKDDRHDIFGKNVSMKLRDLTNNTQRLLAEKIINEALFMAEMGHLTLSHSINASFTFNTPQYCNPTFMNSIHSAPPPVTYPTLISKDSATVSSPYHTPTERYTATSGAGNNYSPNEHTDNSIASFISNFSDSS